MSEMMGVEQEQAKTTKGLAETTEAVKGVESTIADGDRSVSAKLTTIGRVLSIESPAEKAAREEAAAQSTAAAANLQRLLQLQAQGNATDEEVLAAQEEADKIAKEAAEAAEKRSMFDRFGGPDGPGGPGGPDDPGGNGDDDPDGGGGFMKTFGKFFKMIKGFVGILLAIAIPALALILNSPVFETLKKAIFDFIDFFFKEVLPVINDILDNIMPNIKSMFESVKKIFKSISEFFKNLIAGKFDKAFGNLKDIGKEFAKMIDNALTALVKVVLGAFGVNVDKEFTVFGLFKTFFKKVVDFIENLVRALPGGGLVADKFFGKQDAKDMSAEDRKEETKDTEKEVKGLTKDINRQKNKQKEQAKKIQELKKEIAEKEKKLLERGEELTAKRRIDESVLQRNLRDTKKLLEVANKNQEKAKTEEAELINEQNKLVERLDKVADPERQLAAQVGMEGIDDLDETQMTSGGITGMKRSNRTKSSRLIRQQIKAAGGGQVEDAGGDKESMRAAQISAKAANQNTPNIVVTPIDQSIRSKTEQKTFIENNKSTNDTSSNGALAKASEGFM
jgi:hypothetical protein